MKLVHLSFIWSERTVLYYVVKYCKIYHSWFWDARHWERSCMCNVIRTRASSCPPPLPHTHTPTCTPTIIISYGKFIHVDTRSSSKSMTNKKTPYFYRKGGGKLFSEKFAKHRVLFPNVLIFVAAYVLVLQNVQNPSVSTT